MILPNQNLSIMDVRNCIGVPSTDLGTLCSSSNAINMWAKYKPVRNNFTYNRPANWWQSNNWNCGIQFDTYNGISNLITAINNGATYNYQTPRGGESEPFRLGDFAGYDSNAKPPIQAAPMQDTYYKTSTSVTISAFTTMQTESWLTANEVFGNMLSGEVYFGAGIKLKSGSGDPLYMTESTPLPTEGGGGIINFPTSYIQVGRNECFFFLTDTPKTNPISPGMVATFIPLPNGKTEFEMVQSGIQVMVTASLSSGTISGNVVVYNTFGYSVTLNNIHLTFRYASSKPTEPLKVGEGFTQLDNITVGANSNTRTPYSVANGMFLPDFYEEGGGYVQFSANGGQYTSTSMIAYPV